MLLTELEGRALTIGTTLTSGTAFLLFGFDQGVFGGILGNALFQKTFYDPNAKIQGQIVSTYDTGCILGAILTILVGDKLGRWKTIALGCLFVHVGGTLQASSYALPHMIVGRIIAGVGIGIVLAVVPIWQSETCKPQRRGKLIALQLALVIFGIAFTNWMNLGFTYVPNSDVSWRFPLAFQNFFAILAICLLYCMPESPRWLCLKDRHGEAQVIIARLEKKPLNDPAVVQALRLLADTVAHEIKVEKVSWTEVFSNGEQQTFRRIALGAGTSLMQQLGGINMVVYYLPTILSGSFGFSDRLALILSACDFMSLVFWGCMAMLVIDKVGRMKLMLVGATAQGVCFAIAAAGLAVGSKASNGVAVAFIFLYHVAFARLVFPLHSLHVSMYPSEINSERFRNIGSSIAMIINWVGVYIVVLITPIAIENIGYKFYIIFAVLNIVWVPFIWYFYVEIAGLSLDEMDKPFEIHYNNPGMTWKEATQQAQDAIEVAKLEISEKTAHGLDAEFNHVEGSRKV
ncbi:general substrate transporter [Rhexocercosporidium sp. MPI-PUGE-AT-0058]|nr:general substrate transporter [Rhexocercosporidium sp. MPI-PUGE-AT-0058]